MISELDQQQRNLRMQARTVKLEKITRILVRIIGAVIGFVLLYYHKDEECYTANVIFVPIIGTNPFRIDEDGNEYFHWQIKDKVIKDTKGEPEEVQQFFRKEFILINHRFDSVIWSYSIISLLSALFILLSMLAPARKGIYYRIMWLSNLFPIPLSILIIWIIYQRNRFMTRVCFGDFKDQIFNT